MYIMLIIQKIIVGEAVLRARSQEKMRMFYYVSSHSFYPVRTKKPKSENEGETVHLTIASLKGLLYNESQSLKELF